MVNMHFIVRYIFLSELLTSTQKKENNAAKALQSLDFFDAVYRAASKKLARGRKIHFEYLVNVI